MIQLKQCQPDLQQTRPSLSITNVIAGPRLHDRGSRYS